MCTVNVGMRLQVDGYDSIVLGRQDEERYCIRMPEDDSGPVLFPLYSQHRFCFFKDEETMLCAKGQILARYKYSNPLVMEIELIEGLHRQDAAPLTLDEKQTDSILAQLSRAAGMQVLLADE